MKTRYTYWEIVDGFPSVAKPVEGDVGIDAASRILDYLSQRTPIETFGDGYEGDKAWVSFLDEPRAFHIYFESSAEQARYELFFDTDRLMGVAALSQLRQGVALFIERESPASFLESHSLTVYENEA